MNSQEKTLARILFQNKIYKANGQAYEDLFTGIMSESETGFRKIKAWGKIGDQKNDGYIESKGVYYQVYAPEEIEKNYINSVKKIQKDFDGLKEKWTNVQEYYFVINDKFRGVNPESEKILASLKEKHSLKESGFFTSDNLLKELFTLSDDFIETQVGFLPNIEQMTGLDYHILNEVIGFIMEQPIPMSLSDVNLPDWNEKIQFNKLNSYNAELLNKGSYMQGELDKYLEIETTLADDLQKQVTIIYADIKEEWRDTNADNNNIFWELVNQCSPRQGSAYQNAVLTIMAKYFETCDIFEKPK